MQLTELARKIFLDRYSLKDMERHTLALNDEVIVVDRETGARSLGFVRAMSDGRRRVTVQIEDNFVEVSAADVDKPLELDYSQTIERVAKAVAAVEDFEHRQHWRDEFAYIMDDFKFIPGGRILAAAGNPAALSYFNCFVIESPKDSRGGIFDSVRTMAEIMARGGGVGVNLSTLRPRRAYVKGVNGRSSGAVSWGGLYSYTTGLVEQGGSRRGALMLILEDWHPDIIEFINAKRESGKITNANISVGISDAFMRNVEHDGDWSLQFPNTTDPEYDELWDGDINKWVESGHSVATYRTIKARELWQMIVESAHASAEPGIWFKDRSNIDSNSWYYDPLIATNPCHSGSNLIHTRQGLIPIRELIGREFEVISDLRAIGGQGVHYEKAIAYPTGEKTVYEVTLDTKQSIKLTANHKVFTNRGKVAVEDLVIGKDEILIQSSAHLDALIVNEDQGTLIGRVLGWNAGDGWISKFPETHGGSLTNIGFIFNQQEDEARDFILRFTNDLGGREINYRENQGCWEVQSSKQSLVDLFARYGLTPKTRKTVTPQILSASLTTRIGFLQGLFSSDGSISGYRNSKSARICLTTVHKHLAEGVQLLLMDLGIKSRIGSASSKGMRYVTVSGEQRVSRARVVYRVNLCGIESVRKFARFIGFAMSPVKAALLSSTLESCVDIRKSDVEYCATVVKVSEIGVESVYNLTTSISHSLIANGIVVANCGEQPLPAWGVCNLGAINLSRFYNRETNGVNTKELGRIINAAVRFLDNVIDATPYFFDNNAMQQAKERRIGLNTMGLAELMIRCGIRYGSDESLQFIDNLYKFIASTAYIASTHLAAERGSFPMYDEFKFPESGYVRRLPLSVRETIDRHGIRNVTLLTQAPNGTIGTMAGTSTGVEPFFSFSWMRKGRLGIHEERMAVAQEWMDANPGEPLPDYFVTAMDLTPEEHVKVQAAIQKWIDSAISKTCNVPHDYTVQQVGELYQLMHRLGVKGGTVYRDGSRDDQVLWNVDKGEDKEKCPECSSENFERVEGCSTCHDCGYSLCSM